MQVISNLANGFMKLFSTGGQTFLSWVTTIIPTVVCLMTAVNAIDHKTDRRRQGRKILYEDHREQAVPVFISACHRNDLCRQPDGIYVWKICRRKV